MNRDSFSFVIYMIHACANQWGKVPSDVYKLLQKTGCIDNYLVPYYDIREPHTNEFACFHGRFKRPDCMTADTPVTQDAR